MKAVGFIPVRSGSKSIPRKNVRPLAGKPLVLWAVEAAARSGVLDRVVVATDDAEIKAIVQQAALPGVVVVDRDPANATDTASTDSVMLEYAVHEDFDTFVLLQATSPLTTSKDVRNAVRIYQETGADSLVTGVRQKRFIWERNDGHLGRAINYDPSRRPRRQDFDGYVVENGAIIVCDRLGLIKHGYRLFGNVAVYEMEDETYIEIDEPSDWEVLEALIHSRTRQAVQDSYVERLGSIQLVLTDVDGVLTDAGMYYGEQGDELKKFNTRDGKGLELMRKIGVKIGIVTSENTLLVERRARKLKMDFLHQGVERKSVVLTEICQELGISPANVAYIGDDVNDLEILREVGFAACPADAVDEVKQVAHFVTKAKGGEGAVRELCDLILSVKQR
ncbi:acylneuraminate cytidylyltransferase [Fimbriimonas ginsengisoli]|uniref:N-acylneuraminate cytidylyltransferase n=1 Tax=Fimbriimonas ginsengisoli Gsoil 348 TaxID=661478 RepID=A0A068NY60_FIMGI|nr:acylneuraminate cytidylyltransferase [Fimbriimonas ginsengisoli]AIE86669.1 acylneuraminate cytidylyltransferase [Fimbriimonas ginsengisoli Gsoil 348]